MEIKLTKEDLKGLLKSEYLIREIASEIVRKMTDERWNEYHKSLLDAFKEADEEIIKTYIEEYYGADPKNRIIKALEDADKKEILSLLSAQTI